MLQLTLSISAPDASQLSGVTLWRLWHYFIWAEILETDPQLIKSLQLCVATMASVKRVK